MPDTTNNETIQTKSSTISSNDCYLLLTEYDFYFLQDGYLEHYLLENPLEDLPILRSDSMQYLANLEECFLEENLFEVLLKLNEYDNNATPNTQILSSSTDLHYDKQRRQQKY